MRVLLIANSPHVGGGNRSLLTLAVGLREREVAVEIASAEEGEMAVACREVDLQCILVPFIQPNVRRPLDSWRGLQNWQTALHKFKPHLVHANDLPCARSAGLAAKISGRPLICHIRYPPEDQQLAWVFRHLPKPDLFIFSSHALFAECKSGFVATFPKADYAVIHNAVRLDQFRQRPQHGHQKPPKVAIIANLLPVKGHQDFIRLAKILKTRGVEAEFLIAGEDIKGLGMGAELEQLSRELEVTDRVKFLGFVPDIPALLQTVDVTVSCSRVEPFGRSRMESSSCGIPVVAPRVGGIPEAVADGKTGLLVDRESPVQLADKVQILLRDPRQRQRMAQAGRERAETLFSLASHSDQILGLYEQLQSNNRRES